MFDASAVYQVFLTLIHSINFPVSMCFHHVPPMRITLVSGIVMIYLNTVYTVNYNISQFSKLFVLDKESFTDGGSDVCQYISVNYFITLQ